MKGERKLHHQQDDSSFSPSIRHRMAGHARGSAGGEVSAQLGASPYDGHAAAGYYASGSTWVNAGSAQQQQQQQLQQGMHARHSGAGACGSHAAPPSAACDPPPGSKAVSAYSGAAHGGRASTKATFLQSWINLATCVLGAGALGYPFCFKECGLLLATVIMLLTLVATRVSYQLLLYCAQLSGRKTYEGIAEHALGRAGRQAVELCIAAMNLGALVAFLDILADVLSSVAGTIIPPGAEPSRHAYITGVTLLGALPVSLLVREPSLVASMSNAAVVFVVVFAVLVFCTAFGPSAAAALGVRWAALTGGSVSAAAARAARAPVLHLWNPQGVLVSLPVMAYGFTAHQYYMGIYTMLSAPTVRKMKRVTDAALLVCAAVYWTVGVGGYATFGDRTSGDIVRNFGGAHSQGVWGAYERALKLCYGMAVLGNIPLVIMPFGSILAPLLPGDEALQQQARQVAAACSVKGARRATAAALSGCSGSGASGARGPLGAGAGERLPLLHTQPLAPKARSSSSGGGASAAAAPASAHHMDHGAAGSPGVLQQQQGRGAATLDVQLPAWHDSSSQQLQQQQQQKQQRHPAQLWQQHQQEQLQEQRPLLAPLPAPPPRCSSPDDDVPQHPHLTQGAARVAHMLTGPQHTLVVVLVLGVGLASAVWLPNVELIFGLTGSTASVLAAFIMPAVCFLRLYEMAPELGAGLGAARRHPYGGGGAISSSSVLRLLRQLVCCCDCCGLGAWLLARVHGGGSGSRPRRGGDAAWHASPRASGNGSGTAAASAHKVWGPVLVVPELRAQWACRQRLALLLLVFGIISGLLCTDAMLSSISEEKAVVQLAQELVAHEAVVAETHRAQQKAKEAAAAVSAVSTAAQQLGAVDNATSQALGSLTAAAAALSSIAGPTNGTAAAGGGGGGGMASGGGRGAGDVGQPLGGLPGLGPHAHEPQQQQPSVWDLKGRLEQHKQKAVEDGVLRNVEAALSAAAADLDATTTSVTAVIIKLDTAIAQIKADAAAASTAAAAAAAAPALSARAHADAGASLGGEGAGAASAASTDAKPVGSSSADSPAAGAGAGADTAAAAAAAAAAAGGAGANDAAAAAAAHPSATVAAAGGALSAGKDSSASGSGGDAASSSGNAQAFQRANEMARELGKALGTFGHSTNITANAGRSLEQVRDSAIAALTALNVTAGVVRQVRSAVSAARHSAHHDTGAKDVAVRAMQRALNATAASALAMRITKDALSAAATEETSELLTALTRVAQDLERSAGMAPGSSASSAGSAAAGGAGSSKQQKRPVISVTASGSGGGSGGDGGDGSQPLAAAAAAKSAAATAPAERVPAAGADGSTTEATGQAAAATQGSNAGAGSTATQAQPEQLLPQHPTLQEDQSATAAAANAAAHAQSTSALSAAAAAAAAAAEAAAAGSDTQLPAQQQQQQQQGVARPAQTAGAPVAEQPPRVAATPAGAVGAASDSSTVAGKGNAAASHAAPADAAAAAAAVATPGTQAASGTQPRVARHAALPATQPAQPGAAASGGSHASSAGAASGGAAGTPAGAQQAAQQAQQHSGSSVDAGEHSNIGSAASAADTAARQDKALSAAEAGKVRDVIAQLTAALSQSSSTGSGAGAGAGTTAAPAATSSATSASSGGASGARAAAGGAPDIARLSAAIQDAISWTQQSKAAALELVAQDLRSTDPKVMQRVVGIVRDVSTVERAEGRHEAGHAAASTKEAAAAAADAAAAAVRTGVAAGEGSSSSAAGGAATQRAAGAAGSAVGAGVPVVQQQQQQQRQGGDKALLSDTATSVAA